MADAAPVLGLLDGSRDRGQVVAAAAELGIPEAVTDRVLTLLAAGGALDDFPVTVLRMMPTEQRGRLAAELAATALARGHSDGGAAALARRDAAWVQVYGPGRLASALTAILASSGVGRVTIGAFVRPGGSAPARTRSSGGRDGGSGPDAGDRRDGRGRGEGGGLPRADLVVLIGYQQPELAGRLVRAGVPHLAVAAEEAIGTVGPLVRPGRTACLRCVDLTRTAFDPAWPLILAQLAGRVSDPPACDTALAAAVAAQAAAQVLGFLDRAADDQPAENGTLELVRPGWQWRRRTWPPHPACGCSSNSAASPTMGS
jgi:hypothetical protein